MVKKIIAFVGYNGSGKTTTAHLMREYLIKNCYTAEVKSFAEPVRYFTEKYLNINKHDNRALVEEFAQDLKMFDKQIYAKYLINNIDDNTEYIIIDDMRFEEELQAIHDWISMRGIKLIIVDTIRDIEPTAYDAARFDAFISNDVQVSVSDVEIHGINTSDDEDIFLETFDTLIAKVLDW